MRTELASCSREMARQIKQGVDIGYSNALGSVGNLRDFVAGADLAFLQHAKVKAGPVVRHEQSGHCRFVHPDAHAVARYARLRYLEERATNPVTVAYAYLAIGQSVDRKIFAELPECEILAAEVSLPIAIGVQLVDHYRAMLSSMPGKISLRIPRNVQPPDYPPALNRLLPDGGMHSLSSP